MNEDTGFLVLEYLYYQVEKKTLFGQLAALNSYNRFQNEIDSSHCYANIRSTAYIIAFKLSEIQLNAEQQMIMS